MDEASIRATRRAAELTIDICDLQLESLGMEDSQEKHELDQEIAELQQEKSRVLSTVAESKKLEEALEKIIVKKLKWNK